MNTALAEILSVVLLVVVLGCAVARPFGLPEAVVAVPAAGIVVAAGAVSLDHARAEAELLGPVLGFLAAVLVLAKLCDDEGLFQACGAWMARASAGRPRRLLGSTFALASGITAVLSLDATVVLLTPVVFATVARLGARPKPHVYATAHLSNTASLLLPVSNLTNLLAFTASGLTFTRFALLMAAPWAVAVAAEYLVFRRFFASDLDAWTPPAEESVEAPELPMFALVTVLCTLAGFVVTSALGVEPVWAALAGAVVLSVRALVRRTTGPVALFHSVSLPFLAFVLALGIVVRAVVDNGLADALGRVMPSGTGLLALLGVAALAALLSNVINNLPAVLVLVPLAAPLGTGAVLAVLLGVNIGPNLTYAGSLATLLWRRIVHQHEHDVDLGEFTRLGLLTVPAALLSSVVALWLSLLAFGG
ncbi:SLC13 family permease [Streptomyces europaeiscabiei]|uniref:ArsB/NhaD family transporter n=1 Tax=Streptomyces europaeiscabiei TaxID=146819 RepID=A0ABU4NK65_9ACTN|nr:SLC13 family permease [Streptomyces europaeiscabiei]MDX2527477.1 ArsB/NhaD family transporter [Streptomyces europaeiscabiei]MDX2774289.1 ArsB/NhaD family transporter [Streptomyces europaeiscabiei]MDX3545936.1 ArsB/NhaD family transporter [Streptomyces europaeiscabiei]MDX3555625.1 ArsB/NhaD family transporter [Streptomyces europaeiscabiei]MDX3580810.1 ArsB/NhaD family transporter [Streptomyces europaeiscabiei]